MLAFLNYVTTLVPLLSVAVAAPYAAPSPAPTPAPSPELVADIIGGIGTVLGPINNEFAIDSALSAVSKAAASNARDVSEIVNDIAAVITKATASKPAPTNIKDAMQTISSLNNPRPTNIAAAAAKFVLNGLDPKHEAALIGSSVDQTDSSDNSHPAAPYPVYPSFSKDDAPYDVAVNKLRSAIYIPPSFTYGKKPPVIFVPGTGSTGGDVFAANLIPLLQNQDWADPVWLNVPGFLLDDVSTNAEYVAYAVHYIAAVTGRKDLTVVTWSEGALNVQWALKYWPSIRDKISDFVAISPDYHGTSLAYILCFAGLNRPCDPGVIQQEYDSQFIAKLRSNGGDSAYVPTTNIYSSTDEIVQPQTGSGASGYLKSTFFVAATNNEVQAICPARPAGTFYTHEGVLYNPLTIALLKDAMTHQGPGRIERLDLNSICPLYAANGLSVVDVLATEAVIVQSALNVILFFPKTMAEPAIKSYANH